MDALAISIKLVFDVFREQAGGVIPLESGCCQWAIGIDEV